MKTTLNFDDTVMVELKREAARQNRYAADADSQFHVACRGSSANGRDHHLGDPYEFLRVTTHGRLELSPFCPFSGDFALVPSLGTRYMKPCG